MLISSTVLDCLYRMRTCKNNASKKPSILKLRLQKTTPIIKVARKANYEVKTRSVYRREVVQQASCYNKKNNGRMPEQTN